MSGRADISLQAAHSVLRSVLMGLTVAPPQDGLGQIIQISSASSYVGTSYIARNLALIAATDFCSHTSRVGLFDCDFARLAQTGYFFSAQRAEAMSGPYDALFGQTGFWTVGNQYGHQREVDDLCAIYIDNLTGLAVSTIFMDRMAYNERAYIRHSPEYWQVLRSQFSLIFIDGPALDRSQESLTLAPICDSTILVADVNAPNDEMNRRAKEAILRAGGQYGGLLMNTRSPNALVPLG